MKCDDDAFFIWHFRRRSHVQIPIEKIYGLSVSRVPSTSVMMTRSSYGTFGAVPSANAYKDIRVKRE